MQIDMIEPDKPAELQCTDFVEVSVEEMEPIPAGGNPFHYDLHSMGTNLVRGWIAMHDGYSDEFPLRGLYLVNCRSGQRIKLNFTKA